MADLQFRSRCCAGSKPGYVIVDVTPVASYAQDVDTVGNAVTAFQSDISP
jgi:hypothetical protein